MDPLLNIGISSDAEIISRILLGDKSLFEILIRRYNGLLYKIARGYGFPHPDAEDLMQETHVKAYTELARLENPHSYKSWVSKIMINKCLYKLSYGSYRYEIPGSRLLGEQMMPLHAQAGETERRLSGRELYAIIESQVQKLPVNYRVVFMLREVEGFSSAETAELLQISQVNVKVRLNRAKVMLRRQLERSYDCRELFGYHLVYCDRMVGLVFDRLHHNAGN